MTISYLLAPIPKWFILDTVGKAAGGAKLYTRRHLNKVIDKNVYQDPAGTIPYTNPIIFDENGTKGPFYWETDSNNLSDTYYLEAYDSKDNLLWTLDNYFPPGSGGGGGGTSTTYVNAQNMLINNLFWRYSDADKDVSALTNYVIAPSAHASLPEVTTSTGGATGGDIRFIKSNTSSTDRLRIEPFAQGDDPFLNDITPAWSLRFTCTAYGTEGYKIIQFPVCWNVNNIDNTPAQSVLWAKVAVTPVTISMNVRQFYGSGGTPGADTVSVDQPMNLTTTWKQIPISFTIPSANGLTGTCGNDALYYQIKLPLSTCDLFIAKPQLYLGNYAPTEEMQSFDMIDSVVNAPRTGDVQTSFRATAPQGWVAMNDLSIGSATSGATNRANIDTFPLFRELYLNVNDTYAPVSTGRTGSGSTITECITDFNANKNLTLPRSLGRAIAGAGSGSGLTARVLGEYLGTETHTLTVPELAIHTHTVSGKSASFNIRTAAGPNPISALQVSTINNSNTTFPVTFDFTNDNTGSSTPFSIMQPTSFMNVFIKL